MGVLKGGGRRGRWSNGRPVSVCDEVGPPRFSHRPWSDLHKASQLSEGKEWRSDRIPLPPHQRRYKNLPLPPPTTERTGGYIEERVFENFQNFQEPRFKMSKPGFWVFSPPLGKGVNTGTDNLKVHTASSDIRTTSVGTIACSGWLEWRSHECPKVTGTTSFRKLRFFSTEFFFNYCLLKPKFVY
jgi:hypothetical protein